MIAILAHNGLGAPLAGLTPTWTVFVDAVAGSAATQPSFTAHGLGHYVFDPVGLNRAGIIDLGGAANPRYLSFIQASTAVVAFPAWDEFGAPLAGLTPTWHSLKAVDDGANLSQPAISSLGSGLYKTDFVSEHATGAIDLGATAFPRYFHYDNEVLLGIVAQYRMRAFDTTLVRPVYWTADIIDAAAAQYGGPGPVNQVAVFKRLG